MDETTSIPIRLHGHSFALSAYDYAAIERFVARPEHLLYQLNRPDSCDLSREPVRQSVLAIMQAGLCGGGMSPDAARTLAFKLADYGVDSATRSREIVVALLMGSP